MRLYALLDKKGDARHIEGRMKSLFARHHQDACELVFSRDGTPLAAVYFSPFGADAAGRTALMRRIRDAMGRDTVWEDDALLKDEVPSKAP